MINKHQFQIAAKAFRAGRLSLEQFTKHVFASSVNKVAQHHSVQPPWPTQTDEKCEQLADRIEHGKSSSLGIQGSIIPMPTFSNRPQDAHKGDFGKLLLIGGSRGMEGAISLSAIAALRAGAGLVKVAVPDEARSTVAAAHPCYMTIGCHSHQGMLGDRWRSELSSEMDWADLIAIGPGLGRGEPAAKMVAELFRESRLPLVIDADGLNALADLKTDLSQHAGPRVLTPHVGEFCRLLKFHDSPTREQLEKSATQLARLADLIIVLKGAHTLITDGNNNYHNQTGNPGMATAGSGDVLTGILAALLATKLGINEVNADGSTADNRYDDSPHLNRCWLPRVRLAVHCHGLAGDHAIQKFPSTSLIATDLVDFLPSAIRQMSDCQKKFN